MDHTAELIKAVDASNKSLDDFKARVLTRVDALEASEAKSRRPGLAGSPRQAESDDPEVKAFNRYVKTNDVAEMKSLNIGSGPDGGYAVPKVIDGMMETLLLPQSPIRQYAQVQQVSTPDFHKLVNTRGTAASWVGESDARPATAASQLVDVNPPMGELYAFPQATQQMLDDVYFNAGQWIAQEGSDAFGAAESDMFLNGNGVTKPKGILTYATAATADATRAFGTLQYVPSANASGFLALNVSTGVGPLDALQSMVYAMHPGYRGGAAWFMNPTTLGTLSTLKDAYGRFLVTPNVQAGQPQMILGYPVVEAMHMPDIASNAFPIMFANLTRGYLIVDRIGTSVLVDPFSNKPNVGYYIRKRVGGAIQNSRAIKLLKIAAS